jgi:uncharacterized protein
VPVCSSAGWTRTGARLVSLERALESHCGVEATTASGGVVVRPAVVGYRIGGPVRSRLRILSIMTDPKYKAFTALDPFFDIVQQGLAGQVDGEHYFDTIADNAVFEFRYIFPGWPQKVNSREALMALYAGYGDNICLHGADALVVHRSQDARVVILEYDVHGKIIRTGASYDNRFISVITIEGRKIVQWRDYMDSLTAMTALSQTH